MKKIFCLAFLGWLCVAASAIDPPQLRCLAVDNTGATTLTWIAPTNTTGFSHYEIFYSTDGNTFIQITQITNPQIITFTHTAANAHTQPQCFYYVNSCTATQTASSDTLCTIEFYLTNSNGTAILNWASPHTPPLPSSATNYHIWREYPTGIWTDIADHPNATFRDIIDICEADIGYHVQLADESGCMNVSRTLRDIFVDNTAPQTPQLDSVSVEIPSSNIRLGWERAENEDVNAYIIYHLENGMWIPLDTVHGIDATTWVDRQNNANATQQYRIAALDSCLNSSPMSDPQHNIRVSATTDLCRREAVLSWDEYENLPPDLESYRIYVSDNGSAWQYAGEVAANVRTFTLQNLVPQHTYNCIVRAVNLGENITAASTKCSFLFNSADNHDFAYIRYVTVTDAEAIEVKVSTGTTVSFTNVHLYRSVGDEQHFAHLATLTNNGTDTYTFTDTAAKVDREIYYYRATIENDCARETFTSNVAHNILLTGESGRAERENHMKWIPYDEWAGGVSSYQLYRKTQADSYFAPIGGYLSLLQYTDDVSELRQVGETFSYYIEAEELLNEFGFIEKSRSNIVTLKQLPITYIPNAFCPTTLGANRIFLPVNSFVTLENYHLYIYNREGVLLFHATSPEIGWDGCYKGVVQPAGCYVYKIFYTHGSDGEYEIAGTVTLVR